MWTAFILYEHFLFARGLQELLRKEGVEVIGVSAKTRAALEQIKNVRPDLIVTEVEKGKSEAEKLLFRLVRKIDQARVIRVSLEDNSVACYVGRRCLGNTVEELVKCAVKSMTAET
jgi:AmiR/NasT family two-component response regulator